MEEAYTKTFNSFGGADFAVIFNGKICAEVEGIHYEQKSNGKVKGYIVFTNFGRDPFEKHFMDKETFNLSITQQNEYDNRMHTGIFDCKFTSRKSSIGLDTVSQSITYAFKAKKLENLFGENKFILEGE